MELFTKYQSVLNENKQLSLSGEAYSGYLSSRDRQLMRIVFENFASNLDELGKVLDENKTYVAQNASITAINYLNQLVTRIEHLRDTILEEMDQDLYQLSEIPLQGAFNLIQEDNRAIKSITRFRKNCESTINTKSFNEETLDRLIQAFADIEQIMSDRHTTLQKVVSMSKELDTLIERVGKLIDKRQMEDLPPVLYTILNNAEGMTKPQRDLVKQFQERQIFIFRRAERAIDRDEQAIIFFDKYVELLEQIKVYIELNTEILEHSEGYINLQKSIEGLQRIKERRETIHKISGMKDHDAEEEKSVEIPVHTANGKKRSKNPYITISAASFAVFLVILVVVFFL